LNSSSEFKKSLISQIVAAGDQTPVVENMNFIASRPQSFALKVIIKEKLFKVNDFQKRQMLKEVQVQRALTDCGNVLRILKVYETYKCINLVMNY
jgi:DNA gyrase/topoisomerase IV subunit A